MMLALVGGIVLAWLTYSFVTLPLGDVLGGWTATVGKRYGELPVQVEARGQMRPGSECAQATVAGRAWSAQTQPACSRI